MGTASWVSPAGMLCHPGAVALSGEPSCDEGEGRGCVASAAGAGAGEGTLSGSAGAALSMWKSGFSPVARVWHFSVSVAFTSLHLQQADMSRLMQEGT